MDENITFIKEQNNIASDDELLILHKAAIKYATQGIPVFPIVQNDKRPLCTNGFKNATTDNTVINDWWTKWPDANIGIPTGEITGLLVLDVDNKNGVSGSDSLKALIEEYGELPNTRQHLTPSGGYHLIYKYSGSNVPCTVGNLGPGLDVRSNGGYIVAPPSVIGDSRYEVVNPDTPLANAPEWLVKFACEKKAVEKKSVKVAIIPEGKRNDHIFKYGLDCKQQGINLEEAIQMALTENERCAPPLPESEVIKTISSAYNYEKSYVPVEIEEMNKTHAAIVIGGNCYVLHETTCPTFNRPDFELLSVRGFKEFNCNKYIEVAGKKQRLGDAWFSHPKRREYIGLIFNPKQTPPGYYNVWRGFAAEPKEGDCSLYLKHIEENIANGDKAIYDYIIGWMAHTVQHPDVLVGVAIVMKGSMGVGKGVFAEQFGKLFGRHYMLLNDSGQLTGKFNGHMKDKCLLFADEAFWAGDKAAEGKLKSMITESTINVEMKGKDVYTIKNNLHMIFATNNEWAAPAGPKERRFFVIDVGEKHMQDHPYFQAICNQMDNGGREALLHFLMNYDVSKIDLRKFPQTAALREAKLLSASPAQKFWYHVLESGCLDESNADGWGNGSIQTDVLYRQYVVCVNNMGNKHKASETELGMQLKNMLPSNNVKKERRTVRGYYGSSRKNYYVFPSLSECRSAFENFMNAKFEWSDTE